MEQENGGLVVGDESVVIGNIGDRNVGSRCVVIGATDSFGNTKLESGAYGYNAKAGPGSLAVGTNAGAGAETIVNKNNGNFYGIQINDSSLGLKI